MVSSNLVSGSWAVWGVLASEEQSATTVTTPTLMLERTRLAANVRNFRYSYPGIKFSVDCEILVNGQWHPFTVMESDRTFYGPITYRNAKAGMYGEIKPYQETE